jgi:hypothetical protein
MTNQKFTTIRVYEDDKNVLIDRFGGPTHEAFNKVMTENCPHPEKSRQYVTANLPMPGQEAFTEGAPRRTVMGGFYCPECSQYVFPKTQPEPIAS